MLTKMYEQIQNDEDFIKNRMKEIMQYVFACKTEEMKKGNIQVDWGK